MKAEDKPKYVTEARELLKLLDIEKLINNPNDLAYISKINRLIAIFTNFSSNDGQELKKLFQEFQKWARRSTSTGAIRNKAIDMIQFIGQKIEEMDIYVIDGEEEKSDKQNKVIKELKDENLFVRTVLEGKDMHLFISEKGKQEHAHLIADAVTGEIRIDPKDQDPIELVEKVVSVTTKSGKVIEASMRGLETSLEFKNQQELVSDPPILYATGARPSGGPQGHFTYFTIKNIGKDIALDIKWEIRGFAYEWKSPDEPFELDPNREKEVMFQISEEKIFTEETPELNIIMEYKDSGGKAYFTRRELTQERVPSGAFFNLKMSNFHPPSILVDDGLQLISEPFHNGDRVDALFKINTKEGMKKITIGISRSLSSILGFEDDSEIKQALLELAHRKIRKMVKENDLKDHMFSTYELPENHQGGFPTYVQLRDSI